MSWFAEFSNHVINTFEALVDLFEAPCPSDYNFPGYEYQEGHFGFLELVYETWEYLRL